MAEFFPIEDSILGMDAPEHTRIRRLVSATFTARRMQALRGRAQEIVDGLLDTLAVTPQPVDFVQVVALPLPITMICELLGVPFDDRERFHGWANIFMSASGYTVEELLDAHGQLSGYLAGLIASRRERPTDDILGALVAARDDDDSVITEGELISLCMAILVAGYETTANQLAKFVLCLLDRPDQWQLLLERPDIVPNAVEELMRYIPLSAGPALPYLATEDVEIGGVLIRAGDAVIASTASANRDEFGVRARRHRRRRTGRHLPAGFRPRRALLPRRAPCAVSSCRWPSARCSNGSPTCASPSPPTRCRGRTGRRCGASKHYRSVSDCARGVIMRGLDGKVVVVAGGGSGLGAATAIRLADEGASVVVGDLNSDNAELVAAEIRAAGRRAISAQFDISVDESVAALVDAAVAEFGGLDALHANAADMTAAAILSDTDAVEVSLDVFDRTIAVNLRGHLLCTRHAIPRMLERGGGAIVYTSSAAAHSGDVARASYGISKSGINALMRHVSTRSGPRRRPRELRGTGHGAHEDDPGQLRSGVPGLRAEPRPLGSAR